MEREITSDDTSKHEKNYDVMICLVGENPLPIYLGIREFTHIDTQIILVYSKSTEDMSKSTEDAAECVAQCIPHRNVERHILENPYSPAVVYRDLEEIEKKYIRPALRSSLAIALNYTGGTKVMASLFFWFILDNFQKQVELLYLEDAKGANSCGEFHFWLDDSVSLKTGMRAWPAWRWPPCFWPTASQASGVSR